MTMRTLYLNSVFKHVKPTPTKKLSGLIMLPWLKSLKVKLRLFTKTTDLERGKDEVPVKVAVGVGDLPQSKEDKCTSQQTQISSDHLQSKDRKTNYDIFKAAKQEYEKTQTKIKQFIEFSSKNVHVPNT